MIVHLGVACCSNVYYITVVIFVYCITVVGLLYSPCVFRCILYITYYDRTVIAVVVLNIVVVGYVFVV